MPTLTQIADTHLGHRQYGLKQREDDMVSTMRAAFREMVEDQEADVILLPGDLFHSRDLRPEVLHHIERELTRLPEDVPVLVSRGNHDENLTPRNVTWLNYLHRRGRIVFLKANLNDAETARFEPYDPDEPGDHAGFYDVDGEGLDGPVRVFGLQWRGAKTGQALQQVAKGIRVTNDEHGEPAYTVLLAHFGIEDEVPTLGGTITHAELRDVREVVDHLALGHIHKRYEAGEWIFNPGSPEAHNTREGRADWEHGYYSITLTPGTNEEDSVTRATEYYPSKRRPYFCPEPFNVTPYDSPGTLDQAFQEHVRSQRAAMVEYCEQAIFTAQGESRAPIIDLRFTGTLQFSRGDFRPDELAAWLKDEYDALYVQVNSGIRTASVQQLISEIDEDEVFTDGRLNTGALEDRVFETIAEESVYAEHAEDVAAVLSDAHQLAQTEEAVEDISDRVSSARRDLFPELAEDIVVDIAEDPFEDDDGEWDVSAEDPGDEGDSEEVVSQ